MPQPAVPPFSPADLSAADRAKMTASYHALDLVAPGMKLGLGTGSTANWLIRLLAGRAVVESLDLTCVATSRASHALAGSLGLRVATLAQVGQLDLTIDGTDEVDPDLTLIKGGGGAHLREKIVAAASDRMAVIADPGKEVAILGAFDLPVEVCQFGFSASLGAIADVLDRADVGGTAITQRQRDDGDFISDEGHFIVDLALGRIGAPADLAAALLAVPGVVETGLFLGLADQIVIGTSDLTARLRDRTSDTGLEPLDPDRLAGLMAAVPTPA